MERADKLPIVNWSIAPPGWTVAVNYRTGQRTIRYGRQTILVTELPHHQACKLAWEWYRSGKFNVPRPAASPCTDAMDEVLDRIRLEAGAPRRGEVG